MAKEIYDSTHGNEPINPSSERVGLQQVNYLGLTKREYFAAMALQGYCANNDMYAAQMVKAAVKCADLLIEELNNEEEDD